MISSSSDGRVRRATASEVVDVGVIPSPVKPKAQKLVFTASDLTTDLKRKIIKTHYRMFPSSGSSGNMLRSDCVIEHFCQLKTLKP